MQAASARPRLTKERIETEALALIEAEGLAAFSFRGLGQRLGCQAMSLYHHYPSKAHLMDALVDRVMAEAAIPPPGPWRGRIEALAQSTRDAAWKRPAFFQYLALHRLNTPRALGWLEEALKVFHATGLPEEEAVRAFRAYGYYVVGGALDETSGYGHGPSAVDPPSQEAVARDYPTVARAGRFFGKDSYGPTFDFGLSMLLDGIEARLAHLDAGARSA